jgi:hypothetical protein
MADGTASARILPDRTPKPGLRNRMGMATLLALLAPPLAAQNAADAEADGGTPELLLRYRGVMAVSLSPTGDRAALVVAEARIDGDRSEFLFHILVARRDDGSVSPFTRGEVSTTAPAFSPDGNWLAFLTPRSGSNQVWVARVGG